MITKRIAFAHQVMYLAYFGVEPARLYRKPNAPTPASILLSNFFDSALVKAHVAQATSNRVTKLTHKVFRPYLNLAY